VIDFHFCISFSLGLCDYSIAQPWRFVNTFLKIFLRPGASPQ
jgi:hypothetical protein